jgi:hypothetical protein
MKIIDSKYRPMLIKAFEIALAERATQAAARRFDGWLESQSKGSARLDCSL